MITVHGKQKNCRVHRLVASAFIDNPNNYPEVNHINSNREDNRAVNLEWSNRSLNNKHKFNQGYTNKGKHHWSEEERKKISSTMKAFHKKKKEAAGVF